MHKTACKYVLSVAISHIVPIYISGGEFGAVMQVHIQNDGPVTLQFETPFIPPAKEVWIICLHSVFYSSVS